MQTVIEPFSEFEYVQKWAKTKMLQQADLKEHVAVARRGHTIIIRISADAIKLIK
jgi:hypothetical protein